MPDTPAQPPLLARVITPMRAGDATVRDPIRTIAHILRATVIIVGLCALLWVLADAFVIIILAIMFGVMLRGLGNWLGRHTNLWPSASVLIVFLLLVVAICGLGYWAGPRFVTEGQQLWNDLSKSLGNVSGLFSQSGGSGGGSGNPLSAIASSGHTGAIANVLRFAATSFIGFCAAVLVIVATGVYLAMSPDMYVNGIAHLTPVWYQARTRGVLIEMGEAIQGWMLGQLIDMVVVGIVVAAGLNIAGTPLASVLAVVAGVCTFIPYFGTIISAVPAVIVGFTTGISGAIAVIMVFIVAHVIEGYVVAPFVQRRTVHLPPALTLFSFVLVVAIFNILGVLIATPLMACIMVGVARVYVEDVLGDPAGRQLKVTARWYWFTPSS